MLLGACTDGSSNIDPTAPPGVFAPTPSIDDESAPSTTARPRPSTTIDIERAVIYPVDPLTLEALPGFEPIAMSDWVWGQPSNDGTYFAATVGDDDGFTELRLINILDWELEGSWRGSPESELLVTDDGTIYFIGLGRLQRVRAGDSGSETIAPLPVGFYTWGMGRVIGGDLVTFGSRVTTDQTEHASIVSIELTNGMITEIELPEVRIGQVDPESEEPWSGFMYITPSLVWDEANARALVVHGDEDVVSEIDLTSGNVTEHTLDSGGGTSDLSTPILQRSTALSPDGKHLYVSSRRIEGVEVEGDTWTVRTASVGVISIDTTIWQVGSRIDEPIADIHISPAGDRILAWGFSTEEGDTNYLTESTGLFVLDSASLEVLAHYPSDRQDQWYGPFSFNDEVGVGYVTSWAGRARIDVIDLVSGQIITSTEGVGDNLSMIGPIGILSTNR